jgi:hypothetical protein
MVGRIEASGADGAIHAAAVTFGADVRKPIAVRRREIAQRRAASPPSFADGSA